VSCLLKAFPLFIHYSAVCTLLESVFDPPIRRCFTQIHLLKLSTKTLLDLSQNFSLRSCALSFQIHESLLSPATTFLFRRAQHADSSHHSTRAARSDLWLLSLPRTCRQIYRETNDLFWQKNTFFFRSPRAFEVENHRFGGLGA